MSDGMASSEFAPLLPVGRYQKTMAELRQLCANEFPLSRTRDTIMRGLEQVVSMLRNNKIVGELWVNGSFLTEKIDPNDSDVVLVVQSTFCDNATPQQRQTLNWINGDLKTSHCCDSYLTVQYPESHALYWYGEWWLHYWMRQWGFSEDASTMKGIAVVSL